MPRAHVGYEAHTSPALPGVFDMDRTLSRWQRHGVALFLVGVFTAPALSAQVLTLDEARARALEASPDLSTAREAVLAAAGFCPTALPSWRPSQAVARAAPALSAGTIDSLVACAARSDSPSLRSNTFTGSAPGTLNVDQV